MAHKMMSSLLNSVATDVHFVLESSGVELGMFTTGWIMCALGHDFENTLLFHIWDRMLCTGSPVPLYASCLALIIRGHNMLPQGEAINTFTCAQALRNATTAVRDYGVFLQEVDKISCKLPASLIFKTSEEAAVIVAKEDARMQLANDLRSLSGASKFSLQELSVFKDKFNEHLKQVKQSKQASGDPNSLDLKTFSDLLHATCPDWSSAPAIAKALFNAFGWQKV